MKTPLIALLGGAAALSACSGGGPQTTTTCGSATDACAVPTDCCSGFTCIAGTCSFVGGGNNNNGNGNGTGSGPSSSSSSNGGLIGGGSSGGSTASATATSGSSTGQTTGGSTGHAGSSSGGLTSSSSSSGGLGALCASCTSDASCEDGYCVLDPDTLSSYCAPACTTGGCATTSAVCGTRNDVSGTEVSACFPQTGTCACGANPQCTPWSGNPSTCLDSACNPSGGTALVCNPSGQCIGNCNDSSVCLSGQICESDGHCENETTGGTTGGATSGGSTSGGSTGGCVTTIDADEFTQCATAGAACDTATTCVNDPAGFGLLCEYTCATTADCPDPYTFCLSGDCTEPLCSPIDAACAVDGQKGECLGLQPDAGICLANGTGAVNSTCFTATSRCAGASGCVAGAACDTLDDVTYECYDLCIVGTTCSGGTCTATDDGLNGYCP